MRVLVACEYSGIVRDAFIRHGHDAISCDILPSESSAGPHHQGCVLEYLENHASEFDMMIAHPPCTHLSVSGARWFTEGHKPMHLRDEALDFVRALLDAPIGMIALENPVSVISSAIRPADQMVHPWQFGHPEQKSTCFWLKRLPPLLPTNNVYSEMMKLPDKERHRVWYMGGGKGKERSRFYTGIADAMAVQWGVGAQLGLEAF
jgi:site-specific DNA-cytosine methylase